MSETQAPRIARIAKYAAATFVAVLLLGVVVVLVLRALHGRALDAATTAHARQYVSTTTPRMNTEGMPVTLPGTLFGVIEERLRRNAGAGDLVLLLINAYRSPHITEAAPGLRTVMYNTEHEETNVRIAVILEFLKQMQYPFDVIEMQS